MSAVLLVDDEPGVLFTLREVLADRGHRVLTAKNGTEALAQLDEADAVLTDLSMPGMDGLELMAQIGSRDATLPVILLTAAGLQHTRGVGATAVLGKPFDLDELARLITLLLDGPRGGTR